MATSGDKRRADTDAMRASAATLYSEGKRAHEVATALGITERRARSLKADVSAEVKAAASATIEGVVEAGARARSKLAEHGESLAMVLVNAAHGQLEHGDENRDDDPIERDPQMINARTKAAGIALQFVLGHKIDATLKAGVIDDATAEAVLIIARAKAGK